MRLTPEGCRQRQQRLLEQMHDFGVSVAVLGDPRHVLYFTGFETPSTESSCALLRDDGRCLLFCARQETGFAVEEIVVVESAVLSTLRMDHARHLTEPLWKRIGRPAGLVGLDKAGCPSCIGELGEGCLDLGPILFNLRRKKLEDELQLMKRAIEVTQACYKRALEILGPGLSELEMYAELYRTAVFECGEKLPALGNDFQCGSPGGPPRDRKIQSGELYILDLGVELGGYFADNCRTFAVNRDPSREQLQAWEQLAAALELVEETVKPGYSCRGLYEKVKQKLDSYSPGSFFHHLGHGVGLSPHERPNLNPHWNHEFEEGDVFTAEPGLYAPELRGGIRLEENYLVTEKGILKLTSFPLEL